MKVVLIENQLDPKTLTKHLKLFGATHPLILEVCYQLRKKEKITKNLITNVINNPKKNYVIFVSPSFSNKNKFS